MGSESGPEWETLPCADGFLVITHSIPEGNGGSTPQKLVETMAYSEKAKAKRRCTYRFPEGHEREGERCKAWAMWGSEEQLCVAHGTDGRGPETTADERVYILRTIPKCTCETYNFPHRPGGGLCEWPESPKYKLKTPEGTSTGRGISSFSWGSYSVECNVIEPETVQAEAEAPPGEGPGTE